MIIINKEEIYDTQGEVHEEEAPYEEEAPGEKKGSRISEGTGQEKIESPGRRERERRSCKREENSEGEEKQPDWGIEEGKEGPTPKPEGRKRERQRKVQEKRESSSESSETPRGQDETWVWRL